MASTSDKLPAAARLRPHLMPLLAMLQLYSLLSFSMPTSEFWDFCTKMPFLPFFPGRLPSYHWSLSSSITSPGRPFPTHTRPHSCRLQHSRVCFLTLQPCTTATRAPWEPWPGLSCPLCIASADTRVHYRVVIQCQFLLNEWMNEQMNIPVKWQPRSLNSSNDREF